MSTSPIKSGDVFISNAGSECVVLEYKSSRYVKIRFLDNHKYETVVHAANLKKGQVRNPYHPTVCGVGYFGVGPYKSWESGKLTPEYVKWANMLKRCYDESFLMRNPSYKGCRVHDDWHNFQSFALWLNIQPLWGEEDLDLDKDLLHAGNKVYSSKTCVLIPQRINYLLTRPQRENGLPIGVSLRNGRYQAKCRNANSKYDVLGTFDTAQEAFIAYKKHKENVIKRVAQKYKKEISSALFASLFGFVVYP